MDILDAMTEAQRRSLKITTVGDFLEERDALRVALLATTKALGARWSGDANGGWIIDGATRPCVANALKALGLNDPCKMSEWPER